MKDDRYASKKQMMKYKKSKGSKEEMMQYGSKGKGFGKAGYGKRKPY